MRSVLAFGTHIPRFWAPRPEKKKNSIVCRSDYLFPSPLPSPVCGAVQGGKLLVPDDLLMSPAWLLLLLATFVKLRVATFIS